MAALTTQQKTEIRAAWCSDISSRREALNLSKPDLIATLTAIDNWIDSNAAVFNAAIPQPARADLTPAQKAELLYLVARKRFGG